MAAEQKRREQARGGDRFGPANEEARSARQQREKQAMAVLTPEQREQVESFRATHPRPGPGEGLPPPPPGGARGEN